MRLAGTADLQFEKLRGALSCRAARHFISELMPRACTTSFRVRRLANRSGYPIVAGKRPNFYVMNYPKLQAWIEVAHGSLIQVNDAARREWPHIIYLDDHLLADGLNHGVLRPVAILNPTKSLTQTHLDGSRPGEGS